MTNPERPENAKSQRSLDLVRQASRFRSHGGTGAVASGSRLRARNSGGRKKSAPSSRRKHLSVHAPVDRCLHNAAHRGWTTFIWDLRFSLSSRNVLRSHLHYARALYQDEESATLKDVREAVETLEDLERTARRVFGGEHPLIATILIFLREARATLYVHEGDVESLREMVAAMTPGSASSK